MRLISARWLPRAPGTQPDAYADLTTRVFCIAELPAIMCLSTCPLKIPGSSVGTSTLLGHTESFSSALARTLLHAILLWSDQSKSLLVLIDSGADESFMEATLVSEQGIPIQPLSSRLHVRAVDGRFIGRFTHNTIPIHLCVSAEP